MKTDLKKISATSLLSILLFFNMGNLAIATEEDGAASTPETVAPAATPPATATGNSSATSPTSQAKRTEARETPLSLELQSAFDDIRLDTTENNDCLPEELMPGYFYTIMEEPLILKDSISYEYHQSLVEQGAKYISKICYRNTMQYSLDNLGERYTFTLEPYLATRCSEKAQKLQKDYMYTKNPTVIYNCDPVQVLISKGGTSLLEGYLKTLYSYAASIAGIIAVSIIVLSGIQISASGGDSGAIDEAKKRIIKSILGIVVLFLSSIILYTINPNFFVRTKTEVEETQSGDTQSTKTDTTQDTTNSTQTQQKSQPTYDAPSGGGAVGLPPM
jgi:hypothetical protein